MARDKRNASQNVHSEPAASLDTIGKFGDEDAMGPPSAPAMSAGLPALYDRYVSVVYGFAQQMGLGDQADDVVLHTFLALAGAVEGVGETTLTVCDRLLETCRRRAVEVLRASDETWSGSSSRLPPMSHLRVLENCHQGTRDAMRELGARQLHVLALTYFGGYSINQVARMQRQSKQSVARDLAAALKSLRTQFELNPTPIPHAK